MSSHPLLARRETWLRQSFTWRRWQVLVAFLIVGILCATGIILGKKALSNVRAERERAIARATLTDADVERIAKRVVRLESPSEQDILRQVRRSLRVCFNDSTCRTSVVKTIDRLTTSSTSLGTATPVPAPAVQRPKTRPTNDRPPRAPSAGPRPTTTTTAPPPPAKPQPSPLPPVTIPVPTPAQGVVPCIDVQVGPVDIGTSTC